MDLGSDANRKTDDESSTRRAARQSVDRTATRPRASSRCTQRQASLTSGSRRKVSVKVSVAPNMTVSGWWDCTSAAGTVSVSVSGAEVVYDAAGYAPPEHKLERTHATLQRTVKLFKRIKTERGVSWNRSSRDLEAARRRPPAATVAAAPLAHREGPFGGEGGCGLAPSLSVTLLSLLTSPFFSLLSALLPVFISHIPSSVL